MAEFHVKIKPIEHGSIKRIDFVISRVRMIANMGTKKVSLIAKTQQTSWKIQIGKRKQQVDSKTYKYSLWVLNGHV